MVRDVLAGEERLGGERVEPLSLPRSDVVSFHAEDGTRLTVRPSGTEPKVKFYLEAVARVGAVTEVEAQRARLDERCQRIKTSFLGRLALG